MAKEYPRGKWFDVRKDAPPTYEYILGQGPRGAMYIGRGIEGQPNKMRVYGDGTLLKTITKWSRLPHDDNAFWKVTDTGEYVCSECGAYAASNMYNRHTVQDAYCRRCGRAMIRGSV